MNAEFWKYLRLFLIFIAIFLVCFFLLFNINKKSFQLVKIDQDLEKNEQNIALTNANNLIEQLSNPYYDRTSGIIYDLPENYTYLEDKDYVLITPENDSINFIIMSSSNANFESVYDSFKEFQGIKERINYKFENRRLKTSLFDFSGALETINIDGREILFEQENVYLQSGITIKVGFFNTVISGKGISLGLATTGEFDIDLLIDLLGRINEVEYIGSQSIEGLELKEINFKQITIEVPIGFDEIIQNDSLILKAPISTNRTFKNINILIYFDDSLNKDNEFMVLDETYNRSKQFLIETLTGKNYFTFNISELEPQKEVEINGNKFFYAKYNLDFIPTSATEYVTAIPFEITTINYARILKNKTVNIVFTGVQGYSYNQILELSEKVIKTLEV